MGMHVAIRDDIQTLRRIVAMLIALAVLAERVGSRSFPVRWLVLSILRSAEAVAREFVAEATRTSQPSSEGIPDIRDAPEDALLLASRFLALAAALGILLRRSCRSAFSDALIDGVALCLGPQSGRLPVAAGGWKPRPNDTS